MYTYPISPEQLHTMWDLLTYAMKECIATQEEVYVYESLRDYFNTEEDYLYED